MFRSIYQGVSFVLDFVHDTFFNGLVTTFNDEVNSMYIMDLDEDLFGQYDNLSLYRPSNVLIHGLKYDVDAATKQACFYIQDIDETSPCFQQPPTLFLWQSKKTYVTLFDESHLPYQLNKQRQEFRRTFKRRTKKTGEGYTYDVREDIIKRIKNSNVPTTSTECLSSSFATPSSTSTTTTNIREFTWSSQSVNTDDKYLLVRLAEDDKSKNTKDLIRKFPTTYGINMLHDDLDTVDRVDNGPGMSSFTNDISPGTLAQLTYFTEKLIHVDPIRNKTQKSSVCTPSESSFVSSTDFDSHYEAENLNLNVTFDPAVMWVTPYEDRVGLQTSLFQLSEKFGDTYESHVYKLTTSGRYSSDVSLSMAEVKHYMPRNEELNKSLQYIPGDAIIVDSVKNDKKKLTQQTSSENEEFEEVDFDVTDIPTIQINNRSVRKSNFRTSHLKQQLANDDEILYYEDETNEIQINSKPNENLTEDCRNTTESYTTTFDIEEIEIYDSGDGMFDKLDQELNRISQDRKPDDINDRNVNNRNNNNNEVSSYINGKYGLDNCVCDNDESNISHDLIGFDDVDVTSQTNAMTSSKYNTDNAAASLLELAKNVDINLKRLSVNDESEEEDTDTPNIQYSGGNIRYSGDKIKVKVESSYIGEKVVYPYDDENNIQLYDACANDTDNEKNMLTHAHDHNGDSRSNSNLCTCYYDDIDDGPSSDISSDIPDQPSPSNWVYPADTLLTPSPPLPPPPPMDNIVSDDESHSSDILLDLNSFIIPECKTPTGSTRTKHSTENGSDSGFETTHTNGNDRQTPDDDVDINNLPHPPPSITNRSSESDSQLVISLSSDEDEMSVTNGIDRKAKNEHHQVPTIKNDNKQVQTNQDDYYSKIDPEMNSFINSIQGLLEKHYIIENPDDSGEFLIQQRTNSKKPSTKRRSLLDISQDYKSPETKLTEEEERMKRVMDYLTSRKNILVEDSPKHNQHLNTMNKDPTSIYTEPDSVTTAPDMDSFIRVVKEMSTNNKIITKTPNIDSSGEDNKGTAYQEGVLDREKSESLISLESEEEYLQLPSVKNNKSIDSSLSVEDPPMKNLPLNDQPIKSQHEAYSNFDNRRERVNSDYDILDTELNSYGNNYTNSRNIYGDNNKDNGDEEDLMSFLASIKKLAAKQMEIKNINIDNESIVQEKKSKLLKKQKSLLDLATEHGLLDRSDKDSFKGTGRKLDQDDDIPSVNLLSNHKKKKTLPKYDNNVQPETDMTAFVTAVQSINPNPYSCIIKTPESELELPSDYDEKFSRSGSLRGFAELPRSKRNSLHSSTPDLSRYSDAAKYRNPKKSDKTTQFVDDDIIQYQTEKPCFAERKSSIEHNRDRFVKSKSCQDLSFTKAPSTPEDLLTFSSTTQPPPPPIPKPFVDESCESNLLQSYQSDFVTIEDTTITDNSLKDISDFDYVHVPVPPGQIPQPKAPHSALPRYEPFVHIHSPTTTSFNKEERSSSITSEWDDVFDVPTSGKSTPTNDVMEKFSDSTKPTNTSSYEINTRQEPGFVLDMKSYMLSARDLPGNELITQNPIRGLSFDHDVSGLSQPGKSLGRATRDSLEIDSAKKMKGDLPFRGATVDDNTDTESLIYDVTKPRAELISLRQQPPLDCNSITTESSVMRMSELFGSTTANQNSATISYNRIMNKYNEAVSNTQELLNRTNHVLYNNNNNDISKPVYDNKAEKYEVPFNNTKTNPALGNESSTRSNYPNDINRNKNDAFVNNVNKTDEPFRAVNKTDVKPHQGYVSKQNKSSSNDQDKEGNINVDHDFNRKTNKSPKTNRKLNFEDQNKDNNIPRDGQKTRPSPFGTDKQSEARKVGEWIMSKNTDDEQQNNVVMTINYDENNTSLGGGDFTDGINFRSRQNKNMTASNFTKSKQTNDKVDGENRYVKQITCTDTSEDCLAKGRSNFQRSKDINCIYGEQNNMLAMEQPRFNDFNSNNTTPKMMTPTKGYDGVKMNVKVGYKPHQLKYGASEYVDHVIVLPEGQPIRAVEDDYSDQNSDIFVEIKNNLKNNKSPPSIISNRSCDTSISNHYGLHSNQQNGGNKNSFLVEDSPVKEIHDIKPIAPTPCLYKPTRYENKPIPLNSKPTPYEKSSTVDNYKQLKFKTKTANMENRSPLKNENKIRAVLPDMPRMPWMNKKTTNNDIKPTSPVKNTTSYDKKHFNNKPILLDDEKPVKENTQENRLEENNKTEQKNYFVLDSVSNSNENGSFNWYINDEAKKEKRVKITTPTNDDTTDKQKSLKHTIKFYEQDKHKKRRTRSVGNIFVNKTQKSRDKEDECDSGVDSRSCVKLQQSPVRQNKHSILPNKSNLKKTEKNNKLHIVVKENKSPLKGGASKSPVSPSKTGNCRSVLCVKSDPRKAMRGPNGEINFFYPFENEKESEDEEEQLSIYDVKKLKAYNSGLLGNNNNGSLSSSIYKNYDDSNLMQLNSKSWDRGLNKRQDNSYEQSLKSTKSTNDLSNRNNYEKRQSSQTRVPTNDYVDYDLSKSACDLTLENRNENNSRKRNDFDNNLSVSAYDLSRDQPHYYDFVDSNNFYFNSRDNGVVMPSLYEQYRRQDSSDSSSSHLEGQYDVVNASNMNDYRYYGDYHNKRYGSLDCLYPSNYRGTYRGGSNMNSADVRRRLFAGYSYLSLGALPPDHEIIRSPSRESRARELELELNFIRNERKKLREERGFDFYYDHASERKKKHRRARTNEERTLKVNNATSCDL